MPLTTAGAARAGPGATRTGRGTLVFLLIAITALAPAALHMLVPALPQLARALADSGGGVQLVLTVFLAASPSASSGTARSRTASAAARC